MSEPEPPTFSIATFFRSAALRASQSAVAWSLFATVFRLLSGVLVLSLVVRKLPSDHLGLWYVFLTLQGIGNLFDLGFTPAITRAAGYLWAGARELKGFGIAAPVQEDQSESIEPNFPLLSRLMVTMRHYYRFFGVAFGLLMLLGGGTWIWIKTQGMPDATELRLCYALFAFGGFLNATGDLWPALLSGINAVKIAQKIIFGSAVLSFVVTFLGLLGNLGIWALVLGTVSSGAFIRWSGRSFFRKLTDSRLELNVSPQVDILAKLWPVAWRTGLMYVGGFLVVSANTLICSALLNLKVTASYGLSLSLIGMLTHTSAIFTNIKIPLVNHLRASARTNEIAELWIQRTRLSIALYLTGAFVLLLFGNYMLQLIGSRTLLLAPAQLALALLVLGLEMHHVLYANLIISENQNPFVVPALLSGTATVLLSLLLTPHFGVWGMLIGQGFAQACFNNWWIIYRALRGLGLSWSDYWRRYFRTPIRI